MAIVVALWLFFLGLISSGLNFFSTFSAELENQKYQLAKEIASRLEAAKNSQAEIAALREEVATTGYLLKFSTRLAKLDVASVVSSIEDMQRRLNSLKPSKEKPHNFSFLSGASLSASLMFFLGGVALIILAETVAPLEHPVWQFGQVKALPTVSAPVALPVVHRTKQDAAAP
jgi:hypothetical protein